MESIWGKLEIFAEWKVSGGEETFICSDLQLQESGGEESQTHAVSLHRRVFGDTSESDKFIVMASTCLKD